MGLSLCIKANIGVSALSAIPYSINIICGFDIGDMTIAFHSIILIFWIIIENKNFKLINLFGLLFSIIFGKFITFFNVVINIFISGYLNFYVNLILVIIGSILIAIGTYLYLKTNLIAMPLEGFLLAISNKLKTKLSTIKLIFDLTCAIVSAIICLFFKKEFGSVGFGTIITAMLVAPIIEILSNKRNV